MCSPFSRPPSAQVGSWLAALCPPPGLSHEDVARNQGNNKGETKERALGLLRGHPERRGGQEEREVPVALPLHPRCPLLRPPLFLLLQPLPELLLGGLTLRRLIPRH